MSVRSTAAAAVALGITLAAVAASAQVQQFYRPPALISQGQATTPLAGAGKVTLQVFVRKDGTIGPISVKSATNRGDVQTALEIAKSSKYRPGARDAKPVDAYYTFVLNFTGAGASASDGATSGALGQARALVRAGKYAEAKSALDPYLVQHPADKEALTLLGVADAFAGDAAGATAAFDKVGTIDPRYVALATDAYTKAATDNVGKNDAAAKAAATRLIALAPSRATGYNLRGLAEYNAGEDAAAIADLAKARDLIGTSDAHQTAIIDANLGGAYLKTGDLTNAIASAQAARKLDASNTLATDVLATAYTQQAVKAANAGQPETAISTFETGAQAVPARAGMLYGYAAYIMAGAKSPDWTKVKAEADKALATDPNDARANYVAGIALANQGKRTDAKPFIAKAKANVGTDATLGKQIDDASKQLSQ